MSTGSSSPLIQQQQFLSLRKLMRSCSSSKYLLCFGRSQRLYLKWIILMLKYSSRIFIWFGSVNRPLMTQLQVLSLDIIRLLGSVGSSPYLQDRLCASVVAAAQFCSWMGPQTRIKLGYRALRHDGQSRTGTSLQYPIDRYSFLNLLSLSFSNSLPKQIRFNSGMIFSNCWKRSQEPQIIVCFWHDRSCSTVGLLKYSSPFSRQYWIDREVFSGAPIAKYHVIGAIFANSCYIYPVLIFLNQFHQDFITINTSNPTKINPTFIYNLENTHTKRIPNIIYKKSKNYKNMNWRQQPKRRIIMDSGSYTIRIGTAASTQPSITYLNCIAIDRSSGNKLFGSQLENIFDQSKLIYEKNNVRGVTVKFQPYVTMIDDLMAKMEMPKKTTGFFCQGYSMTLPLLPYHPRKIMERYMEIYLEYLRFDGIYIQPSSALIYQQAKSMYNPDLKGTKYAISEKYAVVVQSSQSATYVTPFFEGKPVKPAIKRVDVGGKLLTNYLKQILTFRHLDLKNCDQLIKQIKQQMCFVSKNLMQDMRCPRNTFLKHFIMPDDELKKKGYAVDKLDESVYLQHISLDKERFQIPEILFNPQDIGLEEKGIPDAIHQCLRFTEPAVRHNYLENIIVTGGNTRFSNFNQRLYDELKKNTNNWVTPMIYSVNNPNACFQAAVAASLKPNFVSKVILKDEYRDRGPQRVLTVMF